MTALLFVDAIDTGLFLLDVVALWIAGLTAALLLLVLLVVLAVRAGWRAARNGVAVPQEAEHAPESPEVAPEPHTPAWAHTEKEAA
ncbi:hypothetical protein ABT076_10685 [Streptomyces sp. NPDC002131]|uniref:hypothetical protein n=1 Tax=Streptomyces sp. NPDC002131 TaxID=3154535 RepID=UPI0033196ECB